MLSRRQLGRLATAGLASALVPGAVRPARAATAEDRKFLFLFCAGGWDTSFVFTPASPTSIVEAEVDAVAATVGGIRFVDSPARPSVRAYFERWGARTCVVNGMEVRSVTHERCRQLALTGSAATGLADWPTRLAASATMPLALPHLVVAGPVFPGASVSSVVRVGDDGQLPDLVTGAALTRSDLPIVPPSAAAEDAQDAFVAARVGRGAPGTRGNGADVYARYADALDQERRLATLAGLDLRMTDLGCERDIVGDAATVFDAFSLGASRCAMLRYDGWCGEGWDTHQDLARQGVNFEDLFRYLDGLLAELELRTGTTGGPLSEEVTVVVFSEMGRAPQLNTWGGKDHWTFTSCMLVGAGVRGGQVVGGLADDATGLRVDLASGEATDSGEALLPAHLGATLLALGDVDPADILDGAPIEAVLA